MTTSATPTGVPADGTNATAATESQTQEQQREPVLSPRLAAMDQIDALNTERLNDDLVAAGHKPIVAETEPVDKPADTGAAEPAEVQPKAGETATTEQVAAQQAEDIVIDEAQLARYKVRTKIDGKEEVVPVAEMRQKYQKGAAADIRLDEASRLLREARAEADRLRAAGEKPPVGSDDASVKGQSTDQPSEDAQAAKKELVAALFEGDEQKALQALDKVVGAGRREPTPAPDEAELIAKVTPAVKQQLVVESALEQFRKDYADIASDPYLASIADQFIEAEVKEGKPLHEAIGESGKKTRDWLASKGVKTETATTPTMDRTAKLERKEGIDVIPALNTKATVVEEPEQSASDVIAEMRKARGMTV